MKFALLWLYVRIHWYLFLHLTVTSTILLYMGFGEFLQARLGSAAESLFLRLGLEE